MIVERISRTRLPVAELVEIGRAGIPVADTVTRRRLCYIKIARRASGLLQHHNVGLIDRFEKLQLLGKTEHRPSETTRPRAERRIPLLGIRAAELAVVAVENGLMGDSTA